MNNIRKTLTRLTRAIAITTSTIITTTLVFTASVQAEQTILSHVEIEASPEAVWSILTDFDNYPQWSQFITSIAIQAENQTLPRVGEQLDITVIPPNEAGMDFSPELLVVKPNQELRWRGTIGGMNFLFSGEHYFQLKRTANNQTVLTHGEVFSGWLVPLLWGSISENTPAGFEAYNQAIKSKVESM